MRYAFYVYNNFGGRKGFCFREDAENYLEKCPEGSFIVDAETVYDIETLVELCSTIDELIEKINSRQSLLWLSRKFPKI